jgi:hypothetical protein
MLIVKTKDVLPAVAFVAPLLEMPLLIKYRFPGQPKLQRCSHSVLLLQNHLPLLLMTSNDYCLIFYYIRWERLEWHLFSPQWKGFSFTFSLPQWPACTDPLLSSLLRDHHLRTRRKPHSPQTKMRALRSCCYCLLLKIDLQEFSLDLISLKCYSSPLWFAALGYCWFLWALHLLPNWELDYLLLTVRMQSSLFNFNQLV